MSIAAPQTKPRLVKAWVGRLALPHRFYLAGLVSLTGCFALAKAIPGVSKVLAYLVALLFSAGLLYEVYKVVVPRLSAPLLKLGMTLSTVMAATLSAGTSTMLIAQATGQDPNHFKWALPILAPLSFIPVLAVITSLMAGVCVFPMFVLAVGARSNGWTAFLRFARTFGAFCLMIVGLLLAGAPTDVQLSNVARYAIYWFDMHPDVACSEEKDDRVVRVNDALVIVGSLTSDGPAFVRRACALRAQ